MEITCTDLDPTILPKMVAALESGAYGLAIGSRYVRGGGIRDWPLKRKITSRVAIALAKPLTPVEWADKCDRCHGANGNSVRIEVPALAAQRLDYLQKVLHEYQSGARKSTAMAAMSSVLTDDDVEGLAIHYAYAKARAAVFVPVPSK